MVEMELFRIRIDDKRRDQLVVLREKNGNRVLPIVIGIYEADAIRLKVSGVDLPRPLTHDLLRNTIKELEAELEMVVIHKLRQGTFFAKLVLKAGDGENKEIDARPSDGIALGKQVAEQIEKEIEAYEDSTVSRVGQAVASNSDRPDIPYSFKVIKSDEINAFALPGGFIYIYKGLLDIVNEPELAAILGHEIGHVAARHGIKRIQSVFGYQLAATLALAVLGDKSEAGEIQEIADSIFTLIVLGYSRKDEFQADRLGTIYTYRSGYDPHAMISVLEKLGEHGRGVQITLLSTHPPVEDRISEAEIVIAALEPEDESEDSQESQ